MQLGECSFVVVDCETTGFHPSAHHRVVELALIPVDGDGHCGEAWCSLLLIQSAISARPTFTGYVVAICVARHDSPMCSAMSSNASRAQ